MRTLPRYTFHLFAITFCLVVPLLLAYAAGLRINIKKQSIERIGFLLIDGKPDTADVYLQGVLHAKGLPQYFKKITPDFYSIELRAENYHQFSTTVALHSGNSVVLSPVFLLKKTEPAQISSDEYSKVALGQTATFVTSSDKYRALTKKSNGMREILFDQFEIQLRDAATQELKTIARYGGEIRAVAPLHGTEYLIVALHDRIISISQTDAQMKPITLLEKYKVSEIFSDADGTKIVFKGNFEDRDGFFQLEMREK